LKKLGNQNFSLPTIQVFLYRCHICALQAPDLKSMQLHHDSKHPKLPWEPEKCSNVHQETGGVTVAGVAVQGGKRKK
jgi:hypothetical protein